MRQEKQGSTFSLPSISNLFLVGGFVRLRADEVLSPRGKVPKGRRGRPKGACGMAAPGPPVAKLQCTASLAGARPAGFTSVPGRATVAYGAADPSPAPRRRIIPGVMAGGCCGRITVRRDVSRHRGHVRRVLVWHSIGCWFRAKANDAPDNTDPVGRVTRGSAHCTGRSNVASKEHGHRASQAKPSAWRVCSLLHLRRQHGHMGLAG